MRSDGDPLFKLDCCLHTQSSPETLPSPPSSRNPRDSPPPLRGWPCYSCVVAVSAIHNCWRVLRRVDRTSTRHREAGEKCWWFLLIPEVGWWGWSFGWLVLRGEILILEVQMINSSRPCGWLFVTHFVIHIRFKTSEVQRHTVEMNGSAVGSFTHLYAHDFDLRTLTWKTSPAIPTYVYLVASFMEIRPLSAEIWRHEQ